MAKNWLYWLDRGGRVLPGEESELLGKQSYRVRLATWRMWKSSNGVGEWEFGSEEGWRGGVGLGPGSGVLSLRS